MVANDRIKRIVNQYINKAGHNNSLCPEYGLLSNLYKTKANSNADKKIVESIENLIPYDASILNDDDKNFLLMNFKDVVEFCITSKERTFSHHSNNCQPKEISNLIMRTILHDDINGEDIYNPFCGFASYAIYDENDNYFWGEEIDSLVWAVGQIRLYAHGKYDFQEYTLGDSICNIQNTKCKYRAIICTPPFGLQREGATENIINSLFSHLDKNGQLVIVTPLGWLASKKASKLRDFLLKGRNIELILQLPHKLFSETSIPTAIISITKNSNDSLKLIDASNAYFYDSNKQNKLDSGLIEDILLSRRKASQSIHVANFDYDELDYSDNILLPGVAFMPESEGLTLYQCISVVKVRKQINENSKIFTLKSLSAYYPTEPAKPVKYQELQNNFGSSLVKVVNNSILLSVLPDRVMVGYVDRVDDFMFAAPNIMVLKSYEQVMPKSFVIAYLLSEEIQKQLLKFRIGTSTIYDTLLNHIILPPKNESEIVSDIIKSCQAAIKNEISSSREHLNHYIQSVRMRKHAITQSVSSVSARFNALDYCRVSNKGVLRDNDKLNHLTEITVNDSFEYIKNKFEVINDAIMHIADVEWNWSSPKNIDLVSFIRSFIIENSSHEFEYINNVEGNRSEDSIFDSEGNITIEKGAPLSLIYFPEDALRHIFKNIISNAISYGFSSRKGKSNIIKFDWFVDGENVILDISNNGDPITLDTDRLHYIFMYGYSTSLNKDGHSGQGGAEIYEIMKKYGSKVEIISTPKEEFTVTYQLIFPNVGIDDSSE